MKYIKMATSILISKHGSGGWGQQYDENHLHPTEQWLHAAIVYSNSVMTTYVNGVKELLGEVGFTETLINPSGKVAIGGRMNHVAWFSGLVKTLKVNHMALEPEDSVYLDN